VAGIGFELKKLFNKRGVGNLLKAYGYTGVVTAGPMILGIMYLLGIAYVGKVMGLDKHNRELVNSMVTYALLSSMILTGIFSTALTRYIADMLYGDNEDKVFPSLAGILSLQLVIGGLGFAIFLYFAGISFSLMVLNFIFFEELVLVWNEMSYLTAIKDYKGIIKSYIVATIVSLISTLILTWIFTVSVHILLFGMCLGYGIMGAMNYSMLYDFFHNSYEGHFKFLDWFDEYKALLVIGLCSNVGLFFHIVEKWFTDIGVQIQGLYYGAPEYDIPAMLAFLTILITTINFVASVEVNFYPKYRKYYELYNGNGSIIEIKDAEKEMLDVMENELAYTARKQFYTTMLAISIGVFIIDRLPMGFTASMGEHFRLLSIGYGLFAIANVQMLLLLYFTDYLGAAIGSASFAFVVVVGSLLEYYTGLSFYGIAFVAGSVVYYFICFMRLNIFTSRLSYFILSVQPIVSVKKGGFFKKLRHFFEKLNL